MIRSALLRRVGDVADSGSGLSTGWIAALAALLGALAGFGGALATGWFSYASKDEELRVHLVELAIGILRADPKEGVAPARSWAIDVIEKNSGVPFNKDDRDALLNKPIVGKDQSFKSLLMDKNVTIIPWDGDFTDWTRRWKEEGKKEEQDRELGGPKEAPQK